MPPKDRTPVPSALAKSGGSDRAVAHLQTAFLLPIWVPCSPTAHGVYACLCFRRKGGKGFLTVFVDPSDAAAIEAALRKRSRHKYDQYFCPNLFSAKSREKRFARPTRLAWSDADEADPRAFEPAPSVVWETSPGRFQALWVWNKQLAPEKAETYSRALTYTHGGDKNGWPVNKLLRLPGSFNNKRSYETPMVRLLRCDLTPIRKRPKVEPWHRPPKGRRSGRNVDFDHLAHDKLDVLEKYQVRLQRSTRELIMDAQPRVPDRSKRIYEIVAALHRAGAGPDEIASALWGSAYFQSKYGADVGALTAELSRILSKLE